MQIGSNAWVSQSILAIVLFLGHLQPAGATSALYLSEKEQAVQSTAVVVARVFERTPIDVEVHRRPMQQTRLLIDEVLYGQAPHEVELVQIGGTRDGISTTLPGDGVLHKGDRAVLFLRQEQGKWYLTALGQSVYYLVERNNQTHLAQDLQLNLYKRDTNDNLKKYQPEHKTKFTLEAMRLVLNATNATQTGAKQ
jgi:hypothetical protein